MNAITEKIKMLTDLKTVAEMPTTTRKVMIESIEDLIDDLKTDLDEISDYETINLFFALSIGFVDYSNTSQIAEQIEFTTGYKLITDKWFDYYTHKKDELTQWEYTTRIALVVNSGWTCDIIYATTKAKAIEILLDNYHGVGGDSVEIQHFNGDDWEVVGEYIWRE